MRSEGPRADRCGNAWIVPLVLFLREDGDRAESAIAARAAFAALAAVIILRLTKSLGSLFSSSARMLRPVHASQDSRVGKRIIFNFILVGACLVVGLYLPFFIFLMGLPAYANYLSLSRLLCSVAS